jgi:hypothetical protein
MTQNNARRTNELDFLQLPWAQEVWSSNLHAPTIHPLNRMSSFPHFSSIRAERGSNSCPAPRVPLVLF